jgi:branched-chain amino acid transport system ATP-binding protein
MEDQPMLKVRELTKKFGSLVAVNNVCLDIYRGEIIGLIGPNGAGKTTFFNTITGLYKSDGGKVIYKDSDITNKLPHEVCKLGMSRTFQVTRAFVHMTVEDTVQVGAYNRHNEKTVRAKVDEIIDISDLGPFRRKVCGDLGLAVLRKVELARAMATEPDLLLLDEAGAGLNPNELAQFMALLQKLNRQDGMTFCVVEHVMQMVMNVCHRIYVLDSGELIASGTPDEICSNRRVIEAYLGKRVKINATRC